MHEKTKRRMFTLICLLIFLSILIGATILFWDGLTTMVEEPETFRLEIEGYGIWGKVVFVGLMALQVILAPIPGHPFEVVGGYCFSVFGGVLLTVIGAAIGSVIAFYISRFLGAKAVKSFYSEEKLQKVSFLRASERQNVLTFLFFLIPGVPKDMLAYFMGLTEMRPLTFFFISTVGRLPGIFIAVLGGAALNERSTGMIVAFFLCFILFLALSVWLYKKRSKTKG
ncbi:MAG: TVP38/TMEM64 family protein [Clostridia bacterium]|nr:TVP38/TMEM64 family protein [Clostridia bacterium]